ncbi:MAG TPA: hypothetical protein VF972_07855 [Actinomycetota bacterium]
MPTLDLIVSAIWIGALLVVILAQAVFLYLRHRLATKQAESAARLAKAIAFPPGGRDAVRPPPAPTESTSPAGSGPTEASVR